MSFLRFLEGVLSGLTWAGGLVLVGVVLQVPASADPGTVDLHDFAALGMLTACGRMALGRRVIETRTIRLDHLGREFVDVEFEEVRR